MENRVHQIIEDALLLDFAETDAFDPETYDYAFSGEFTEQMRRIFVMADRQYVSVGRRRIRRAAALALAAALIMVTAACGVAVTKPLVKWLTSENEEQGTMDVTFEVEDPDGLTKEFRHIKPETPEGYRIVTEDKGRTDYYIEYEGEDGTVIYYIQSLGIDSMGLSVDNENADFSEIEISGYKGYSYSKAGNNAMIWTDGTSLFQIIGTCRMELVEEMVKSIR